MTAPLAFLLAGIAAASLQAVPSRPSPPSGEVRLAGRVESVPDRIEDRVRFLFREAEGRLLEVSAPRAAYPIALGDRLLFSARLELPPGPPNPGARDRAAAARARGVLWEARAREPPARAGPPSPLARLEAFRDRFAAAAAAALPPRQAALVRALGSGDASAVDPATLEAFARSGLAHILSVSGLHLAVVAFGTRRVLWWLLDRSEVLAARLDPRRASAALAVPLVGAYALATGAQVPVVRSGLAALAVFAAVVLQREPGALDALALAALAILAVDPAALGDVSFQLSFASVAGLALLTRPLRRRLPLPLPAPGAGRLRRAGEWLLQAACASAAAALATAPLTALHFRRLSLLAVPANLTGVPLGSALTVLAAVAAAVTAVSPALAAPLLWACGPLATALGGAAQVFGAPSWSTAGLASPGEAGAAACYGLGLAALALRGRLRLACAAVSAAALLAPGPLRALAARHRGGLEVTFLSVGQGDAVVMRFPDGAFALVDAGGDPRGRRDPGARDVVPFIRDGGGRRLAAAFLSHPHADHLLGLPAVAEALSPAVLFSNGRRGDAGLAQSWARLPRPVRLARGDAWERAGVRVEVLGPPPGAERLSENEASLVLRVRYGETAFLLLGDVEGEGEAALLAAGHLAAEVVKVAHHGSRNASSEALAAAVRPRWAVVSLSRHNPFGFPHPEATQRWRDAGAEVLRTDRGALRFWSDGRKVRRVDPGGALDAWALWREASAERPRRRPHAPRRARRHRAAACHRPGPRPRVPPQRALAPPGYARAGCRGRGEQPAWSANEPSAPGLRDRRLRAAPRSSMTRDPGSAVASEDQHPRARRPGSVEDEPAKTLERVKVSAPGR